MAYLPVKPGNQGQPEFSSEIEETYINIVFLLFDTFDHKFHCNKAEKVQGVSYIVISGPFSIFNSFDPALL